MSDSMIYARPELNKLGNVIDVTFDDSGWSCSNSGDSCDNDD